MYKCIKGFSLPVFDDNGRVLEDKYSNIEEDSIWGFPDEYKDYRFIGGDVRLESDELGWIEISDETFELCFKLVA